MKTEISRLDPEKFIWIEGRPRDFWISHRENIAEFIKEHKIKAIARKELLMDDPVPIKNKRLKKSDKEIEAVRIKPQPFPGYLRVPHFHYRDKLYLLNEKQWRMFSEVIVNKFQKKLSKSSNVNFEQVMELSNAIDRLG